MNELFHRLAVRFSNAVGSPKAFILALLIVIGWGVCGPIFNYSNTWQLMINTTTTIATVLMVFLIQNTQNRDARVTQLKLDELLKSIKGANRDFVDLEDFTDAELSELQEQFHKLQEEFRARHKGGKPKI